jgi:hypothetical protein
LDEVRSSDARGPLFAKLRDAEARGLDVDAVVPRLVVGKSLGDAFDIAAVLHGRVDRWTKAAGGRRRHTENLIAGLIPRAHGVTDPDMAQALAERDQAMEERALALAEEAIAAHHSWLGPLGRPPNESLRRERWTREVSTVAAYRDRWHIEGKRPLGAVLDERNLEQRDQRRRALAAGERAKAIAASAENRQFDPGIEVRLGVEIDL